MGDDESSRGGSACPWQIDYVVTLMIVATGGLNEYFCRGKVKSLYIIMYTLINTRTMKKENRKVILKLVATIAAAILSTLGAASCMLGTIFGQKVCHFKIIDYICRNKS